jgi:hypothetical protein
MPAVASVPPVYTTSQPFRWWNLVYLWHWESSAMVYCSYLSLKGDRLILPAIQEAVKRRLILNEEAAVTFWQFALRCLQLCLTIDWRSAFCASVQVARLACVLIGSLAKLSSSFCKRSLLASRSWLMLSLARWSHQWLSFGFKVPLWYLTLSWFSTKHEAMLQLTILVVLDCIMFWIEPFAYRVCCTQPRQVLDRIFCYQSLTVLNCIRFWIELLLSESCFTQQHQVLSRPFAIGAV